MLLLAAMPLGVIGLMLGSVEKAAPGRPLGDSMRCITVVLNGSLVALANTLPITPGGIGVGETVSSNLFAAFGSVSGAEISLVVRTCYAVLAITGVGALLFVPRMRVQAD